ncbi:MAG: adenosine deaminase [Pseudomonadota bacterium]
MTGCPLHRAVLVAILCVAATAQTATAAERWFEDLKATATPEQLYRFLYAMPKGADLHNHLPGADRSEWLWDAALGQRDRGYVYYTRVRIQNCHEFGRNEFGPDKTLLFKTIQDSSYRSLDACGQSEFKALTSLDEREKQAWMDSQRLNESWEGRDEFFNAHFDRVNDLLLNPYVISDILLSNMEAFGKEGLVYLELMQFVNGAIRADGSPFPPDEVADIYRKVIASPRARATGVEVRFISTVLRFAPDAEDILRREFATVARHRDLFVGVNLVGREDNDKGYPLRFLPVLRELRHKYSGINLSIHAGEVDEPDAHIRDTLLLGAQRIGHGVNLITDPEGMRLMRNGPYLVEINLVSNLLLEYVSDYSQHPFGEYLRTGIPVALSTDDRGMWDSNMTDEFFVAVREFNLSWEELVLLGRNSLKYSFLDEPTKQRLLEAYEQRMSAFAQNFRKKGWSALSGSHAVTYSFTCRRYKVCLQ